MNKRFTRQQSIQMSANINNELKKIKPERMDSFFAELLELIHKYQNV